MAEYDGRRVGLVLGGGAARGIAHIGVLAVLEEAGIPIHYVSAASAGAIIGAAYCAGVAAVDLADYSKRVGWLAFVRPAWPRHGLVSLAGLESWIVRELGDLDFADLKTPLAAMTVDLRTGEAVILQAGRVAPAVRASCSVPGVVAPVMLDGRMLGDGGVVDNLPVGAARALGADYIIAVNLMCRYPYRPGGPLRMGLLAIESLVRNVGGGIAQADCLICPALEGISMVTFRQSDRMIALGRQAAEEALPAIRRDLGL